MNPERLAIFESVARVRSGNEQHRNPNFARHTFRIHMQDYYALRKLFPGLASTDPHEVSAAWEEFERSPFSEPYRIGAIVRGVVKNGNLIK